MPVKLKLLLKDVWVAVGWDSSTSVIPDTIEVNSEWARANQIHDGDIVDMELVKQEIEPTYRLQLECSSLRVYDVDK